MDGAFGHGDVHGDRREPRGGGDVDGSRRRPMRVDTKSYSYTWTDAGADDTFPAAGNSVDCGPKGRLPAELFDAAFEDGASFDCQVLRMIRCAGTFEVKATVTDDDGGAGSGSVLVKVAERRAYRVERDVCRRPGVWDGDGRL